MQRRQARERRDYLYRRALTLRDAEIAEKRAKLKASLATGKPLDPTIANDKQLKQDYKFDETRADRTTEEELELDDEYSYLSGVVDPRILVTTSRDPSSRLGSFAKEIRLLLPTAIRLNRGNLVLPNLVGSAKSSGLSDVILLHEHRGTPTAMTVSHLPHGPTASFSLHNVVLRHDIPNASRGTVSESYPHLIFEGFTTKLGKRTVKILQHLFPPRETGSAAKLGSRVVTFKNIEDSIEVRHHVFVKTGYRSVELAEVGPRMTMRLFEIRQGTADNKDGDVEWHMNQYTRTSKKKDYFLVFPQPRINLDFKLSPVAANSTARDSCSMASTHINRTTRASTRRQSQRNMATDTNSASSNALPSPTMSQALGDIVALGTAESVVHADGEVAEALFSPAQMAVVTRMIEDAHRRGVEQGRREQEQDADACQQTGQQEMRITREPGKGTLQNSANFNACSYGLPVSAITGTPASEDQHPAKKPERTTAPGSGITGKILVGYTESPSHHSFTTGHHKPSQSHVGCLASYAAATYSRTMSSGESWQ
ncbi:snoRNA-binding rRNA-processing protein imp4 [Elasticomyces elasticus]|nr:snoRNA-binding rRNA-processing protein imp4 [Elasticomyces elasticus]